MEEHQITEEDVIGFEALYISMLRTKKGVLWKDSVAAYYHRGCERTDKLTQQLHDGSYKASPPKHFTITSPKRREIASIAYRDRVYQRSLNDNVVYPVMTRRFIYDNYACQTGKGTDPARDRLKEFLRRYYRKHGANGWVAQLDVHGYYPNMKHSEAEKLFHRNLPGWAYERVKRILREQYAGDTGYNPGSQLVQIAGISMLDKLDHFIKEKLRMKLYIRYMDDLIMIHESMEELEKAKDAVAEEFAKIGFELNPIKSRIYPIGDGIHFLGFRFHLSETGKVYMIADPEKVKAARKKYRRLVSKAKRNGVGREYVDASFRTYLDHLSHGDTWKLRTRLQKWYNDLWKEWSWKDEDFQENGEHC